MSEDKALRVGIIGAGGIAGRIHLPALRETLNAIFARTNAVTLDHLEDTPRREIRRLLRELGMNEYVSASVMLHGFGLHAIPVDEDLVECLEMDGYVHPGSAPADVQGFLERVIAGEDAARAHEFFREYLEKRAKALAKRRKARAEAEAKAQAEAKAKAKAAEAARRRKARKAKKAKKVGKAKKARAAPPARKKAVKKPAARGRAKRKARLGKK